MSPRVILAFSPSKNAQFTAQVAKGFRLGGINDPLNVTLCSPEDLLTYGGHPTWDDEKVTNFELGTKTRFADGRVTLNAAVFMSKIDGLQVVADAERRRSSLEQRIEELAGNERDFLRRLKAFLDEHRRTLETHPLLVVDPVPPGTQKETARER